MNQPTLPFAQPRLDFARAPRARRTDPVTSVDFGPIGDGRWSIDSCPEGHVGHLVIINGVQMCMRCGELASGDNVEAAEYLQLSLFAGGAGAD